MNLAWGAGEQRLEQADVLAFLELRGLGIGSHGLTLHAVRDQPEVGPQVGPAARGGRDARPGGP